MDSSRTPFTIFNNKKLKLVNAEPVLMKIKNRNIKLKKIKMLKTSDFKMHRKHYSEVDLSGN
jgi:hypothetical protein